MQNMVVPGGMSAESNWPLPLVEDGVAYGGFRFEFKDVQKLK